MKRILATVLIFAGAISLTSMRLIGQAPVPEEGSVRWMTFEQAVEKCQKDKRPIFVDVYTDWCGWCKVMDKETFSDPKVAQLLNEKFYPVKFNAEQKEDVIFKGHTFKFVPSGRNGYHQLAASLLQNQLSYPTVVFVDVELNMAHPLPGYRKAPEFHMYVQYYGDQYYKKGKEAQAEFQKNYKSPY